MFLILDYDEELDEINKFNIEVVCEVVVYEKDVIDVEDLRNDMECLYVNDSG